MLESQWKRSWAAGETAAEQRVQLVKSALYKSICRFSAIPIKTAANFLYSLCIKVQKLEELKQFWKNNEVGVIILLYFKTSFYSNNNQGIVLTEERHLDQWNRIKKPRNRLIYPIEFRQTCKSNLMKEKEFFF